MVGNKPGIRICDFRCDILSPELYIKKIRDLGSKITLLDPRRHTEIFSALKIKKD